MDGWMDGCMDGWINGSIHWWMDWSNERKIRREGIKVTSNKKRERGVGAVGGEWRKMIGNAVKEHYSQNIRLPVNLSGDCKISSVRNFIPRTCRVVDGVVSEMKSVSWGGARTKGEVHKRELTKICSCTVICWHQWLLPWHNNWTQSLGTAVIGVFVN